MTYKEVQRIYSCKFGRTIKTCWIADVKRQMGFQVRNAHNRKGTGILNKCPLNLISIIKDIINRQPTFFKIKERINT